MASRDTLKWISGESEITKFKMADGWGVWRCAACGSPVPTLHPAGGAYRVPVGLLDSDPGVRIAAHIFVAPKAAWDELAGDAPQLRDGYGSRSLS